MSTKDATLERWCDPKIAEPLVAPYYIDNLFRHYTFNHALESRDEAMKLGQLCLRNGIFVDRRFLQLPPLAHDSGVGLIFRGAPALPPEMHNASHEEVSGYLFRKMAGELDMPDEGVAIGSQAIASTALGKECETIYDRIMRRSDLANVGQPNQFVLANTTYAVYHDDKILSGQKFCQPSIRGPFINEFSEFARQCAEPLTQYIQEDLSLGPFEIISKGETAFSRQAKLNITFLKSPQFKHFVRDHLERIVTYHTPRQRLNSRNRAAS